MWDEQKRARFRQLRQQEVENSLAEAEKLELAALVREVEDAEASFLEPAARRLRQERETIEAQNRTLSALAHRKEALLSRLRAFLVDAQAEQRAIENELATIRAGSRGSEADA